MTEPVRPASAPAPVLVALRASTAEQHEALEREVGLLAPPLGPERFVAFLQRSLGFHRVAEPALDRALGADAQLGTRSRIALLRSDLLSLGETAESIEALPDCIEAADLFGTRAKAFGVLYVIEGSTLGGQVIERAVRDQPWRPERGLRSFEPYGAETGSRWKATREQLADAAAHDDADQIVAGAVATFALLRRWFQVALPTPAPA